jgi:chromosome segregation ATPase
MDLQNLQEDVKESPHCKGASKDPQQSKASESEHPWMMEIRQKAEGLKIDSDNVDNLLEQRIAELQEELDDALSKLEAAERENLQLRMIKDSLVGIHSEMEQLIESLEPMHVELLEQTNRVNEAWAERAAIKQELNRETIKVQENAHQIQVLEARIRDLEAEATERTAMLNGVFIELKNEQALRSEDADIAQQEILSLNESLESYATDIVTLQDALRVANEELRKIKNIPVALLS